MRRFMIILFMIVLWNACTTHTQPPLVPLNIQLKHSNSDETPYTQGLLSEYDVWLFLNEHPTAEEIIETIGAPDSVWVDEAIEFQMLYYYMPEFKDYNSVEIDLKTKCASGFEWD